MTYQPMVFGRSLFFLVLLVFLTKSEGGNFHESSARLQSYVNKFHSLQNDNSYDGLRKEFQKSKNVIFLGRRNSSKSVFDHEETHTVAGIVKNCVNQRRKEIIRNFAQGKAIIVNCFKAAILLKLLSYLARSSNTSIKIFNGILEFREISNPIDCDDLNEVNGCKAQPEKTMNYYKNILLNSNQNYFNERMVRMFVDDENKNFRVDKNEEIDGKLDVKNIFEYTLNEIWDKSKEDEIKRELADPKILTILNVLSRLYLMKINFFPNIWLEVKRSLNDGIIFDLVTDVEYSRKLKKNGSYEDDDDDDDDDNEERDMGEEKEKAENENDAKKYPSDDVNKLNLLEETGAMNSNRRSQITAIRHEQARSGTKKKKKKFKKKKILKHLLIPFAIQMAILPFFLKKLFLLAAKALLAGKAALVLIVFNMLRNSQTQDENYSIRVEHYGYKKGEEYGAWINGRNFKPENSWFMVNTFNNNQEPYRGRIPNYLKQ